MRNRRIRDIVIELTSLLDVVMILIFAVMMRNAQLVEAKTAELGETQEQLAEAQEKLEELEGISEELANALGKLEEGDLQELLERIQNAENQLEAYDYMDDIVVVFNVGLENRYNNTERCLTYGSVSGENEKQYSVRRNNSGNEWPEAINHLHIDLKNFIDNELVNAPEDTYVYIIFSVDESKVYANDYEDVIDILEKAEAEYGDGRVRYRLNNISEE